MLVKATITSSFFGFAFAGFEQIGNALTQAGVKVPGDRLLASHQFTNYGCWCYMDETHGKGRGPPVDEFDALCKELHHNYECLLMETAAGTNGSCAVDPWEVEYTTPMAVLLGIVNLDFDAVLAGCESEFADDECKMNVCKTEIGFGVRQTILQNTAANRQDMYEHENGFMPLEGDNCPIKDNSDTGDNEKKCCGPYPNRFPYKTNGGDRGCCSTKTFDVNTLECCNDGSGIKFIGGC